MNPGEMAPDKGEFDFSPIAASLRASVIEFYRGSGIDPSGEPARLTLDTNSILTQRRAELLLYILRERTGVESLDGLEIVDLGAGFGALALFFAARGARVTAIDPNDERFAVGRAVAEAHGLPVNFKRARMECTQLRDSHYDVAMQNNSFCFVVATEDRAAALKETRRILRPGGWVITRDPNRWHPLDPFTGMPALHLLPPRAAVRLTGTMGRKRSLVRLTSPLRARRELTGAGFTEVARSDPPGRSGVLGPFGRYHHFAGRRPTDPSAS